MGYVDAGRTGSLNWGGWGASLLINGGMAVALIYAAPNVMQDFATILTGYDVPPDPKPEKVDPITKKTPPTAPTVPHTVTKTQTPVKSDGGLILDPDVILPLGGGGGTDLGERLSKPDPLPDPAPAPVIKTARLDPRFADTLQPPYPTSMIRAGLSGIAVVRVLVGSDGRVKAVEPVRADDEAFMKVTRDQALRKWRFVPATSNGAPIESWREMTVRFVLPD